MSLPAWLKLWFFDALIGEIYPSIRAIALGFTEEREIRVIMYLDRDPTEDDEESLEVIVTHVLANISSDGEVPSIETEALFSDKPMGELNILDGLVFARREYDA